MFSPQHDKLITVEGEGAWWWWRALELVEFIPKGRRRPSVEVSVRGKDKSRKAALRTALRAEIKRQEEI